MTVRLATPEGEPTLAPTRLVIVGWSGRDARAVRHHVEELARLGVPPPSRTPLPYAAPPGLVTQSERIAVLGAETSGEAEPVVVVAHGRRWLTLGSDHTDRGLEAHSVAHAKAVCPKPLARDAWPLDAVAPRWDALRLASEIEEDGRWVPYQDARLDALLPLDALLEVAAPAEGTVAFLGTPPALGGVRPAPAMRMRLEDGAAGRAITLGYRVDALPVVA